MHGFDGLMLLSRDIFIELCFHRMIFFPSDILSNDQGGNTILILNAESRLAYVSYENANSNNVGCKYLKWIFHKDPIN